MRSRTASVFLLVILGACATPAHNIVPVHDPGPASTFASATTSAPTAVPKPRGQDYSPRSLYLNAHADFQHKARPHLFLNKAEPFRTPVRASLLYQGQSEIDGERGDLQWPQYNVNALVPIPVDQDVTLLVGGNFEVRDYDFDGILGATQDDRYYRIDAQVGGTWFVQEDLAITGLFSPGIYSDLDGSTNHRDWYFKGSALATWQYADDLYLKVGVAVDETFDDVPVYPLLGLAYVMSEDWRIDVLLPWAAIVSWMANSQTTISGGLSLEGAAYNIRSSAATGKVQTENRVQEIRLFAGVDHQFSEQLSIFGRFGTLLGGDYDIRTNGLPTATSGQIEPALFFEVGLGWSF